MSLVEGGDLLRVNFAALLHRADGFAVLYDGHCW